ncbi:hypothetical protein F4777DRAFT_590564 [Nemania sp. FL0916]|nr:hypothetical protein F4777DRAFT_590564 [Nemania sp. FL0916]
MIQTVLFQQEEIWKEFTYNTWPQYWPDGEDGRFRPPFSEDADIWREIAKPQSQFPKYRKRFEKLDDDAERVERHILVQLDLKQKHATMKETHTATVMSAAIVGFTVITIIFAPLSFLASLFALPIDQFQQREDGKYTTNYVGRWMATGEIASLAITAAAIWLACEYFLKLQISRSVWNLVSKNLRLPPLHFPSWKDIFRRKRVTSDSATLTPQKEASGRLTNPEDERGAEKQRSSLKNNEFLSDLLRNGQFWKSKRRKSHDTDLEKEG